MPILFGLLGERVRIHHAVDHREMAMTMKVTIFYEVKVVEYPIM